MKKLKFLPIFLVLCLAAALFPVPAPAAWEPEIDCPAAIVLDRRTGDVLWSRNAEDRVYPAGLTEIMTVLLAVEAIESGSAALDDQVTASAGIAYDLGDSGASLGIQTGETLTLEDLLYAAMLASAGDAANMIAVHIGGSVEAFVGQMNRRAEELGCTGTRFANTHGLHSENHYTTAADMGRIALEAARHTLFMQLCGATEKEIAATNLSSVRNLNSPNALINSAGIYGSRYFYERADGMKTGYTNAAGYCLVATADDEDSGVSLLTVVFGGQQNADGFYTQFADSVELLDWTFENFSYQEILDPGVSIASVHVSLGRETDVNLRPDGAITLLLPDGYDRSELRYDLEVYSLQRGETVTAPITSGEVLGEVSVLRNGQNCGTVKLVAASSVDLDRMQYIKSNLDETFRQSNVRWAIAGLIFLLAAYIIWVIVYRIWRLRYRHAVKAAERAAAPAAAIPGRERKKQPRPAAQEPQIEFFSGEGETASALPEADAGVPDGDLSDAVLEELRSILPDAPEPQAAEPAAPQSPAETASPPPGSQLPELSILRDKVDRDYFEEFFRQK